MHTKKKHKFINFNMTWLIQFNSRRYLITSIYPYPNPNPSHHELFCHMMCVPSRQQWRRFRFLWRSASCGRWSQLSAGTALGRCSTSVKQTGNERKKCSRYLLILLLIVFTDLTYLTCLLILFTDLVYWSCLLILCLPSNNVQYELQRSSPRKLINIPSQK